MQEAHDKLISKPAVSPSTLAKSLNPITSGNYPKMEKSTMEMAIIPDIHIFYYYRTLLKSHNNNILSVSLRLIA